MKHYFNTLNERERWMLIVSGLCLLFYLYYFWMYVPLSHYRNQKINQLTEKMETLQWMRQVNRQERGALKKTGDSSQLLTLIASALKHNRALRFPYQLQQIGSGDIQLRFEKVPFQFFLKWLDNISKKYTITIQQLDVDPTSTPGLVRLMIILKTPHNIK